MDAAIAALADGVDASPGDVAGLGSLAEAIDVEGSEPLAKVGRTSMLTRGGIAAIELDDVPFDYPGLGRVLFDGMIEIAGADGAFTLGGDSGSLVVTDSSAPAAVGLHIGTLRTNGHSIAAPLPAVLEELGVTLVR